MLKSAKTFVETFKNYASYIHSFSLTDNFQNSRKKGEKDKKFRDSLPVVFYEKVVRVKPLNSGHPRVLKKLRNHIFRTPFHKNTSGWLLLARVSFLIKLQA